MHRGGLGESCLEKRKQVKDRKGKGKLKEKAPKEKEEDSVKGKELQVDTDMLEVEQASPTAANPTETYPPQSNSLSSSMHSGGRVSFRALSSWYVQLSRYSL